MNFTKIDLDETHIRLTTDLENHDLKRFIFNIRRDLKDYILRNNDFLISMSPLKIPQDNLADIVVKMIGASDICDVGPMACVAGTISEMSLDYLIRLGSFYSIVENGGDIAMINDRKVLCGIYSNNDVLGNNIAFEIKKRKKPLGICTSSGKIGHSISFGESDSVTVIGNSPAVCDGLSTKIANSVSGDTSEDKVMRKIPKVIESKEFHLNL